MSDADDRTAAALALFSELIDLSPEARVAALETRCTDPALRAEVESLLQADSGPSLAGPSARQLSEALEGELPGKLGPFSVLGLVGRGGMGSVYRARQEQPDRTVALKVLSAGRLDEAARRRFELEIELLGRLDHEGIARIHAAGSEVTTSGTHPWFAMEFVDGAPLLEHAARLARTQRLELFLRVCDAVEHAHRHGVIHRDLKSANVLVTDDGRAKVLDFGVARGVDPEASRSSALTLDGQVVGTLSTMSPEQARGDVDAIDTRTDVYALGVLLHQLLTDRPPLPLDGLSLPEALRRITDSIPAPVGRADPSLAGDLEVIVGKALEKEPAQRYGSVGALAEDLRRHLDHRPILAAPPDTLDRILRFARRHRFAVTGATLLTLALVSATWISLSSWSEAERERAIADEERRVAQEERGLALDAQRVADEERVAAEAARRSADEQRATAELERDRLGQLYDFLRGTFGSIDPNVAQGREISVREILDAAAAKLSAAPPSDPTLRADMHGLLGETYGDLSLLGDSRHHLDEVLELAAGPAGTSIDPQLQARALADLAIVAISAYDFARAEELATRLTQLAERDSSVSRDHLAVAWHTLSMLQTRGFVERLELVDRALLELDVEAQPALRLRFLQTRLELLAELGEFSEAVPAAEHALKLARSLGRRSSIVHALSTRALLAAKQGDPRAATYTEELLAELDQILGPEHPQTSAHLLDVLHSWMNATQSVPSFASDRLASALEHLSHAPGDVSPNAWKQLAQLHLRRGDWDALLRSCDLGLEPHAELLTELARSQHAQELPGPQALVLASLLEMRNEARYRTGAFAEAVADGRLCALLQPVPSSRFSQFMTLSLLQTEGFAHAEQHARQDIAKLLAAGQRADAAQMEFALGQIAERYAETPEAEADVLAAYRRGIALADDADVASTPNLDVALRAVGRAEAEAGQVDAAVACLLRISASLQGAGPAAEASAWAELAGLQFALWREDSATDFGEAALSSFERAVSRRREAQPFDGEALAGDLGNHAIALGQLGRRDACLARFDEALTLLEGSDSPLRAALAGAREQLSALFETEAPP